ncbi:MAG: hypothetical protein ACD_34C00044G0001, partial [uncultured bacterium]
YHPIKIAGQVYANEISAFFKSIWRMGLKPGEGRYFWGLVLWTLFNCPTKFALGVTLAIFGYHFRKVNLINQNKEIVAAKKASQARIKHPSIEQSARHAVH